MDRAALPRPDQNLVPGFAGEDGAAMDRLVDQSRPLGEDPPGPQGIMADLGIAHIIIGGQADRLAVGLQSQHQPFLHQQVEGRGVGDMHSVALVVRPDTDTVHDDGYHRARKRSVAGKRFQFQICHFPSFQGSLLPAVPIFHVYRGRYICYNKLLYFTSITVQQGKT